MKKRPRRARPRCMPRAPTSSSRSRCCCAWLPPRTACPSDRKELAEKLDSQLIARQVAAALAEDVGAGDVTAALVPSRQQVRAHIVAREPAVLCGTQWVTETFRQLDASIQLDWKAGD